VENGKLWVVRSEAQGLAGVYGFDTGTGSLLNKRIGGASIKYRTGWTSGGFGARIAKNEFLQAPRGITLDQKYIYVTESILGRVQRYDKVTGDYRGWMGVVGDVAPTSGAKGCTALVKKQVTPGWCFGGQAIDTASTTSNEDGALVDLPFYGLWGIASDGKDIYTGGSTMLYHLIDGAIK
jgi:hypothetical protein